MPQLEHIEAIEKRLWSAADNLRANSNYASNEYFLPVMGLVFLRHAYSRYLAVKAKIEPRLPSRGGKTRALTKEDFSQQGAIYLRPKAQFDHLVALPDSADRARAIIEAMESIEADYENLRGVLPKGEYQELDNQVLGQLLRTLNPDELKKVSGDVFGRIYEYFLTQFADQKAHDGGEFFTPVSLVSLIAHVLDPERGTVLDPACGSGGMFVQSARIVEEHGQRPTERLTCARRSRPSPGHGLKGRAERPTRRGRTKSCWPTWPRPSPWCGRSSKTGTPHSMTSFRRPASSATPPSSRARKRPTRTTRAASASR